MDVEVILHHPTLGNLQMPAIVLLISDRDHDTGWLPAFNDCHDLVRFGPSEIGVEEFVTTIFRRLQNGSTPFLRPVYYPVLELPGDIAKHVAAHRVDMPVRIEEAYHPFGLLEWLDQSVQQQSIEASIPELNAILVVLVKGVHGSSPVWSDTWSILPWTPFRPSLRNLKARGYQGRSPWLVGSRRADR